jgi:MOSC domain-containing protein YiiM
MSGTIERIRVYPEKGAAGIELSEARLIEGLGLEGDFHAVGGERQVSILLTETRRQMTEQNEKGLCFSRFRENITISGIISSALKPGATLTSGEAILEITDETKRCHRECSLYKEGKHCPLSGFNLFAKVSNNGVIRNGGTVYSG